MRRAEWRRRADDPKGMLGWWWSAFRTRNLHWVYLLPVGCAVVCGLLGAGWWLLVMVLAAWAFALSHPLKEVDRLAALLPDPAPEGQFRATVVYRSDGIVRGRDCMALTEIDGWLYGEGTGSHFALRAQDVEALTYRRERARTTMRLTDGSHIEMQGGGERTWRRLEGWRRHGARPKGEPTFPPSQVHPQQLAWWATWSIVGMAMVLLPPVVAAFVHLGGRLADIKVGIAFLGTSVFLFAGERLKRLLIARHEVLDERNASTGQAPSFQRPVSQDETFGERDSIRA